MSNHLIYLSYGYVAGYDPNKPPPSGKPQSKKGEEAMAKFLGMSPPGPRTRGNVRSLSRRSRNELLKLLARIPEEGAPEVYCRLEHPLSSKGTNEELKKHINLVAANIRHNYPEGWFVWRISPGNRTNRANVYLIGSPGAHSKPSMSFKDWLTRAWSRILKSSPSPKRASIKQIEYGHAGRLYATISEFHISDHLLPYGRRWGVIGKAALPQAPLEIFEVTPEQYAAVKALIAEYLEHRKEYFPGERKASLGMEDIVARREDYKKKFEKRPDFFMGYLPKEVAELVRDIVSSA